MKKHIFLFSLLVSIIAAFTPMTAQAQQGSKNSLSVPDIYCSHIEKLERE